MEPKMPLQLAPFTIAVHPCCTPYSTSLGPDLFLVNRLLNHDISAVTIVVPSRSHPSRREGRTGFPISASDPLIRLHVSAEPTIKMEKRKKAEMVSPAPTANRGNKAPRTSRIAATRCPTLPQNHRPLFPSMVSHGIRASSLRPNVYIPTCIFIFRASEPSRASQLRHRPAP